MKLVDMKSSGEAYSMPAPVQSDYPYGLQICLCDESLDALGIEELPEVGAEMMVQAKVRVVAVSMNDSEQGGEYQSMQLQIIEMGVDKPSVPLEKKFYKDR